MDAQLAEDQEVDFSWYLDNPLQYDLWRINQDQNIILHQNDPRGIELEVFKLADLNTVPEAHCLEVSRYLRAQGCSVGRTVVTFDEFLTIRRCRLTARWKAKVARRNRRTYGCIYHRLLDYLPVSDAEDDDELADGGYPEDSEADA